MNKFLNLSQKNLLKLNSQDQNFKFSLKKKIKNLKKNSAGRNNSGKITVKNRGGGHKRKYREIQFLQIHNDIGFVYNTEYDPNRKAKIAAIFEFTSNNFFYTLLPKHLEIGNIVQSGKHADLFLGNCLPLYKIPIGSFVHNITTSAFSKSKITRAAGTFSKIVEKTSTHAKLIISSGKRITIPLNCSATLGVVSNKLARLTPLKKAGRTRWLNKRPKVRGVAMNPIDHPHGGGEGKKSGKGLNYWGKPVQSGKTGKRLKK